MLVNLSAFTVMAQDDITGNKYEKEARILAALNIMGGYKDGSFRPDAEISRAEYADIVSRILFETKGYSVSDAYFVDVQSSHWAAPAIYMLADMGIINKSLRFRPDEAQTCYDAVRVLLNLLGYESYATSNGGYPEGYLSVANSLQILNNVVITPDTVGMTRGNVARLIYNALEVEFAHPDDREEDQTILSWKHIITSTGTVCAVHDAAIDGYTNVGIGDVLIVDANGDTHLVSIGDTDVVSMLGQRGRYYIDENEERLLYFGGSASSTDEFYISAEDIEEVGDDYISYLKNDRVQKVSFSPSIVVILNGERLYSDNPQSYMWPELGGIRLKKSNGSSKYDIAYVSSYEAYIADIAISTEGKLIFKSGINSREYILTDDYTQVEITRDGKKAELKDIQEWDVIHIAEKKDGSSITINASSANRVSGAIDKIGKDTVTVAGNEYYVDWRVSEADLYPALRLTTTGIFYYNMNNEIFAWKVDNSIDGTYGYLKSLFVDEEKGEAKSTIYTLDGEFIQYEYDKRVVINGAGYKNTELKNSDDIYNGAEVKDQLIKYKTGVNGKIKNIETAKTLSDGRSSKYGYDDSQFTLVLKNNYALSSFIKIDHYNNGKFDDTYLADNNTKVIVVPESMDKDKFEIMTVKEAFTGNTKYRNDAPLDIGEVMLYDADRFLTVPIIVCKTAETDILSNSIDYNSDIMLVDECGIIRNSDNETAHQISGIYKGQRVTYEVDNDININFDSLHWGIGIQFSLNKDNVIAGIRILFDIENSYEPYVVSYDNIVGKNETVGWNSNQLVYYGNVYDKKDDGSQIMINTNYDWDHYRGFLSTNMRVYKYNMGSHAVGNATYNDLICSRSNPQKVVFRAYRSLVKELVIIED